MTERMVRGFGFSKKLLLIVAGWVAVAMPIIFGLVLAVQIQAQAQVKRAVQEHAAIPNSTDTKVSPQNSTTQASTEPPVTFDVISIKPVKHGSSISDENWNNTNPSPDGYRSSMRITQMIMVAYGDTVGGDASIYTPLLNLPTWSEDWYDIDARVSNSDLAAWQNQSGKHELLRTAMRDLLKERCKLAIHAQPTELLDYKMVVGKKGLKLKANPPDFVLPSGGKLESGGVLVPEKVGDKSVLHFYGATMGDLASFESRFSNRPVHDMTGIAGRYNFTFQPPDRTSSDSIDEATQFPIDALGLELKPGKYSGITLVIDHVEKPSEN